MREQSVMPRQWEQLARHMESPDLIEHGSSGSEDTVTCEQNAENKAILNPSRQNSVIVCNPASYGNAEKQNAESHSEPEVHDPGGGGISDARKDCDDQQTVDLSSDIACDDQEDNVLSSDVACDVQEDIVLSSDSVPTSQGDCPESIGLPTTSSLEMDENTIENLGCIVMRLMSKELDTYNWPFLERVDSKLENLWDYDEVITQPMWLRKIKEKLDKQEYETLADIIKDLRLMFENCYRYNGSGHSVSKKALRLEEEMEKFISVLPEEMQKKVSLEATSGLPLDDVSSHLKRRETRGNKGYFSYVLYRVRHARPERIRELKEQLKEQKRLEREEKESVIMDWEKNVLLSGSQGTQLRTMWEAFEVLGVEPKFWEILGQTSPFVETAFHNLTYQQRVWIVKSLCDWILQNHKTVGNAVREIESPRPKVLGFDRDGYSYLYFPEFSIWSVRAYKMGPVLYVPSEDEGVWSPKRPRKRRCHASEDDDWEANVGIKRRKTGAASQTQGERRLRQDARIKSKGKPNYSEPASDEELDGAIEEDEGQGSVHGDEDDEVGEGEDPGNEENWSRRTRSGRGRRRGRACFPNKRGLRRQSAGKGTPIANHQEEPSPRKRRSEARNSRATNEDKNASVSMCETPRGRGGKRGRGRGQRGGRRRSRKPLPPLLKEEGETDETVIKEEKPADDLIDASEKGVMEVKENGALVLEGEPTSSDFAKEAKEMKIIPNESEVQVEAIQEGKKEEHEVSDSLVGIVKKDEVVNLNGDDAIKQEGGSCAGEELRQEEKVNGNEDDIKSGFAMIVDSVESLRSLIESLKAQQPIPKGTTLPLGVGRTCELQLIKNLEKWLENVEPWEAKILSTKRKILQRLFKENEMWLSRDPSAPEPGADEWDSGQEEDIPPTQETESVISEDKGKGVDEESQDSSPSSDPSEIDRASTPDGMMRTRRYQAKRKAKKKKKVVDLENSDSDEDSSLKLSQMTTSSRGRVRKPKKYSDDDWQYPDDHQAASAKHSFSSGSSRSTPRSLQYSKILTPEQHIRSLREKVEAVKAKAAIVKSNIIGGERSGARAVLLNKGTSRISIGGSNEEEDASGMRKRKCYDPDPKPGCFLQIPVSDAMKRKIEESLAELPPGTDLDKFPLTIPVPYGQGKIVNLKIPAREAQRLLVHPTAQQQGLGNPANKDILQQAMEIEEIPGANASPSKAQVPVIRTAKRPDGRSPTASVTDIQRSISEGMVQSMNEAIQRSQQLLSNRPQESLVTKAINGPTLSESQSSDGLVASGHNQPLISTPRIVQVHSRSIPASGAPCIVRVQSEVSKSSHVVQMPESSRLAASEHQHVIQGHDQTRQATLVSAVGTQTVARSLLQTSSLPSRPECVTSVAPAGVVTSSAALYTVSTLAQTSVQATSSSTSQLHGQLSSPMQTVLVTSPAGVQMQIRSTPAPLLQNVQVSTPTGPTIQTVKMSTPPRSTSRIVRVSSSPGHQLQNVQMSSFASPLGARLGSPIQTVQMTSPSGSGMQTLQVATSQGSSQPRAQAPQIQVVQIPNLQAVFSSPTQSQLHVPASPARSPHVTVSPSIGDGTRELQSIVIQSQQPQLQSVVSLGGGTAVQFHPLFQTVGHPTVVYQGVPVYQTAVTIAPNIVSALPASNRIASIQSVSNQVPVQFAANRMSIQPAVSSQVSVQPGQGSTVQSPPNLVPSQVSSSDGASMHLLSSPMPLQSSVTQVSAQSSTDEQQHPTSTSDSTIHAAQSSSAPSTSTVSSTSVGSSDGAREDLEHVKFVLVDDGGTYRLGKIDPATGRPVVLQPEEVQRFGIGGKGVRLVTVGDEVRVKLQKNNN
ncbi:unnamed protein product [Darwinula stevensoni]|uniref:Bromo domain-containing protein n=1 Tax=Darwinula stevensoni TaxID=69355 RepID=A0A7R8X9M7_9CRUS|nr:unnamed protein product [Darwinula stevensoni]CAG0889296.1 unnamed protein product [Darwinula stevensoni]